LNFELFSLKNVTNNVGVLMKNQKKIITREVLIGNVSIGGNNPIRVQSMTNTKTEDVEATVTQILQLYDHGCEIVRMTVQGQKQAYALEKIKNLLVKKKCLIPLVADIHFYPPAALIAADFVDKIRINPGNFAEKRTSDADLNKEKQLLQIEETLCLLIDKLKKNKVALRIGVNHGSLSDRIVTRFGNTIKAMVESAIEYGNICRKYNFHNLVFSMKASSSFIMIEAYRSLVNEMIKLNWDYPLHLGVTEAGDEEDGIIKSSIGIGSLLLDGIGDTIRVSLTEDPIKEIKPAKQLIKLCEKRVKNRFFFNLTSQNRSINKPILMINPKNEFINDKQISLIDIFYIKKIDNSFLEKLIKSNKTIISKENLKNAIKIFDLNEVQVGSDEKYVLEISSNDNLDKLKNFNPFLILYKPQDSYIDNIRKFINYLSSIQLSAPVIACLQYKQDLDDVKLLASSEIGLLLYEKLVSGILLETRFDDVELGLNIFQGCNLKKYKTEFISCPGCGRTLFDIQKTLKEIKDKTSHLSEIKIAIMGCIVNGLGEMQDADFGYIGSLPGKIDLYANNTCVEKNIEEKDALEKLISLIKEKNKWQDKES
jgi:(E)-4-hydroxy-3-methylbut-2-enyl-diphosphate synthase